MCKYIFNLNKDKMKTRSNELNFAPSSPAGDMITETPTAGGEGDSQQHSIS